MEYDEFKVLIQSALQHNLTGLTWREIKETLKLPYKIPSQTQLFQLEDEIHLVFSKGKGSDYIWKINK